MPPFRNSTISLPVHGWCTSSSGSLQELQALALVAAAVQVHLNMWLAGYYADPSVSLDGLGEQLAAWLVSCRRLLLRDMRGARLQALDARQ